jgi:hypothetical protein
MSLFQISFLFLCLSGERAREIRRNAFMQLQGLFCTLQEAMFFYLLLGFLGTDLYSSNVATSISFM